MDDHSIRRLNRATRVQAFGRANAADLASSLKASQLFAGLDPIISKLNEAKVGQLRGPVGKQACIEALSLDFKDIARTARAIKIEEPGFPAADFRHPATYVETPIATHADSLLKLLEDNTDPVDGDTPEQLTAKAELRAKFIAYELPTDFVEDLRADRNALDLCNTSKHSDNLKGVESTSSIDTLLSQVQGIITRLDAVVKNKFRHDPDKLAAWKSASHVERAAKKAVAPVPPVPN